MILEPHIRTETESDWPGIRAIIDAAFVGKPYAPGGPIRFDPAFGGETIEGKK